MLGVIVNTMAVIAGGVVGFFVSRKVMMKYMKNKLEK